MEQNQTKGAKDFFINLGASVALYTVFITLINLLFTIINRIYPQIIEGYTYSGSGTISWPVAVLVIFFPILIGAPKQFLVFALIGELSSSTGFDDGLPSSSVMSVLTDCFGAACSTAPMALA